MTVFPKSHLTKACFQNTKREAPGKIGLLLILSTVGLVAVCGGCGSAQRRPGPDRMARMRVLKGTEAVSRDAAIAEIESIISAKGSVTVKVFGFTKLTKDLSWVTDVDVDYGTSTVLEVKGQVLSSKALLNREYSVPPNKTIALGEILAADITSDTGRAEIKFTLTAIRAPTQNDRERATRLASELEAFTSKVEPQASLANYLPIVPIIFDLIDLIHGDVQMRVANLTLLRRGGFCPVDDDVEIQGAACNTAFVVYVGPFRFVREDLASKYAGINALLTTSTYSPY